MQAGRVELQSLRAVRSRNTWFMKPMLADANILFDSYSDLYISSEGVPLALAISNQLGTVSCGACYIRIVIIYPADSCPHVTAKLESSTEIFLEIEEEISVSLFVVTVVLIEVTTVTGKLS